ncbi:crossover junction endonuclease EME1B-like [Quillaja saponaria]|uniref:Crossover junction endonuclease EME1B-like n=1 Tax=Quillaja saponaria TaxID=32244 RepID=A0AAD7PIK8_QUISA|nr:crossover junction endonuclease EME1B-like [Quillaja saponaria]
MYQPIILSDEEDQNEISTPFPVLQSKKRRTESDLNPTVVVLDDDPTPQKLRYSSTPSFVAETPMSVVVNSDVTIVKCTIGSSDHQTRVSTSMRELSGIDGLICLESDNESENISGREKWKENVTRESSVNISSDSEWIPKFTESMSSTVADQFISSGSATLTYISDKSLLHSTSSLDVIHQVHDYLGTENASMEQEDNIVKKKRSKVNAETKNNTSESMRKKNTIREERARLMEEKKLKKEQEKLRKEALKAETEELKKIKKEMQKWENSKFACKIHCG